MKGKICISQEREEFRLQLEKDKEIALKSIDMRKEVAVAQASVLGEAFKKSEIRIIGGDGQFFDRFVNAASLGQSIDGATYGVTRGWRNPWRNVRHNPWMVKFMAQDKTTFKFQEKKKKTRHRAGEFSAELATGAELPGKSNVCQVMKLMFTLSFWLNKGSDRLLCQTNPLKASQRTNSELPK